MDTSILRFGVILIMKLTKTHKIAASIALTASALTATGLAIWSSTPSYALFDAKYIQKDISTRFDEKAIADDAVEQVAERFTEPSVQALQNPEGIDGFTLMGHSVIIAAVEAQKPALKQNVQTELEQSLKNNEDGNLKFESRDGNTAVYSMYNSKVPSNRVHIVMENRNGYWKFTKLAASTIDEQFKIFQNSTGKEIKKDESKSTQTAVSNQVKTEVAAQIEAQPRPEPKVIVQQQAPLTNQIQSTGSNTNALIYAPTTNCRSGPGQEYEVVSKFRVKTYVALHHSLPDSSGELWYQDSNYGCFVHESQVKWQ